MSVRATILILVLVLTQVLFTIGDLMARGNMRKYGFTLSTFLSGWFVTYFIIRQVAMFGQLYVFSYMQLGKSMALFGAVSIVLSNMLAFLLLGEVLSLGSYLGVTLAILAFIVLAMIK